MDSSPAPLPPSTDVLVLGAGLAGLRAALSCLEASPSLRVTVVSLTDGPSGSSFANRNDALGFHACLTDREREDYQREVRALNRGAWLSERLLALQAEEGAARLHDLLALGFPFARDASGELLAHSSCFSPDSRRAFVFAPLAEAYACFRRRLDHLGCVFRSGWMPARLVGDPVSGAAFFPLTAGQAGAHAKTGEATGTARPVFVAAKAVVAALGGPARLFAHTMAGPGVPGYGQGLVARAGARMTNLGFLQYMWGSLPGKRFWQPAEAGEGGWSVRPPGEKGRGVPVGDLVPALAALAGQRAGHCPYGHGLPDSALDLALARHMDSEGVVRLLRSDGRELAVAPMAHASNGGAVIDEHGQTSVPGLLACGECATGMHGSNRLGGCMVLATQVFGHRAGKRAALLAGSTDAPRPNRDALAGLEENLACRRRTLSLLASGLSCHAVPGAMPGTGSMPASMAVSLSGAAPGAVSGAMPGTGSMPASMAVSVSGAAPGAVPGAMPGSTPKVVSLDVSKAVSLAAPGATSPAASGAGSGDSVLSLATDREAFARAMDEAAHSCRDWYAALCLETAGGILAGLPRHA